MKRPEPPPPPVSVRDFATIFGELSEQNLLQDLYKIEREHYPYWEDLKYRVKSWGLNSQHIWGVLKQQRAYSRQKLELSDVAGFTFRISIPGLVQKYLHELDMYLGGTLVANAQIPADEKNRYLISSIMEESIASSQLEGAATTRKVAKEMLETKRPPANKSEKMILNNYTTMQWIVKHKNELLTSNLLCSIHKIITSSTLEESSTEGSFRTNDDVKVMDENNEIHYTPPSNIHINTLIEKLCAFANDEDKEFIHPINKAIILHFLIGYIHPFVDGNGRTARALFYWYLLKKGYWLVEYMSISRIILQAPAKYARAYLHTEYDENDLTYFILYNIKAMKMALDELRSYINRKQEEKKQVLSLLRGGYFNERQVDVIKELLKDKNRIFTVNQIENRFGVSNQTARNDLMDLIDKGVLEKGTSKKAQFFAVPDFEKMLSLN